MLCEIVGIFISGNYKKHFLHLRRLKSFFRDFVFPPFLLFSLFALLSHCFALSFSLFTFRCLFPLIILALSPSSYPNEAQRNGKYFKVRIMVILGTEENITEDFKHSLKDEE